MWAQREFSSGDTVLVAGPKTFRGKVSPGIITDGQVNGILQVVIPDTRK